MARNKSMSMAKVVAREQQAIELALAGQPYAAIGLVLHCSASRAAHIVRRGLERKGAQPREELRAIAVAKCERLLLAHWPRATGSDGLPPDPEVGRLAVRIMARHDRLLGLDAPLRLEMDPPPGPSDEERQAETVAMLRAYKAGLSDGAAGRNAEVIDVEEVGPPELGAGEPHEG